jgi:uncharacterized protein (DUF1697 family)
VKRWCAFLRGVNVGGHGKLPMKPLCAALEARGFQNARSYIQSGNLVFDSDITDADALRHALNSAILEHASFAPEVMVFTQEALALIHAECPYKAPSDGTKIDSKTVHFLLFDAAPDAPNLAEIARLQASDEQFTLSPWAAYLSAPSGIGRSRLMAAQERLLTVPVTARNLRTIEAVLALARA